jgi:hypothetical protein
MHIVGCIFGSNIHLEIVQRSTDVLVFLVQAKALSIDDIDLVWAAVGVSLRINEQGQLSELIS